MTNTKHTPSPWIATGTYTYYREAGKEFYSSPVVAVQGVNQVRGVSHVVAYGYGKTPEEAIANARLIAAAEREQLRDSLRVLLDWCERMQIDGKHLIGSICKEADDAQFRAAIKQAREALG